MGRLAARRSKSMEERLEVSLREHEWGTQKKKVVNKAED